MSQYVDYCLFKLGSPMADVQDYATAEKAVKFAFDELRATCTIPVEKTVPYSRRIDCNKIRVGVSKGMEQYIGFRFKDIYYVKRAQPPQGSYVFQNSTDVFSLSAAVSANLSGLTFGGIANVTPFAKQLISMQIRNTLITDMQYTVDKKNNCIYVTAQAPFPTHVTLTYQPWYESVDEIDDPVWDSYLRRWASALLKENLGRAMSKYEVESQVSNNGSVWVEEARAEQDALLAELKLVYNNICSLK